MSDAMNLDQRLRFLKMDKAARSRLADARPVIEAALQPSLEAFYAQVRATPDVARFFGRDMAGSVYKVGPVPDLATASER